MKRYFSIVQFILLYFIVPIESYSQNNCDSIITHLKNLISKYESSGAKKSNAITTKQDSIVNVVYAFRNATLKEKALYTDNPELTNSLIQNFPESFGTSQTAPDRYFYLNDSLVMDTKRNGFKYFITKQTNEYKIITNRTFGYNEISLKEFETNPKIQSEVLRVCAKISGQMEIENKKYCYVHLSNPVLGGGTISCYLDSENLPVYNLLKNGEEQYITVRLTKTILGYSSKHTIIEKLISPTW